MNGAALPDAPPLLESATLGLGFSVESLPPVLSSAARVITGTVVATGQGAVTIQTGSGLVIIRVRAGTMVLADGQLRPIQDITVGQSIAILREAVETPGSSTGPVNLDRATDKPSGSAPGIEIDLKGISIKVP